MLIVVRLGDTLLWIAADTDARDRPLGSPCRLDIDPGSVQVWPAETQAMVNARH